MHIIITDGWLAKSRAIQLSGWKLLLALMLASLVLMLSSLVLYHWVFLKGVREGWPLFGSVARVVNQGDLESQDIFLRENLDVMAKKVGELQAKIMQLDALGERVAGLAGMNYQDFKKPPAQGGMLVGERSLKLEELQHLVENLEHHGQGQADWLTAVESRLFDQKIKRSLIPTQLPVPDVEVGSRFGYRIDPFTGRGAMHTGLDFPAPVGTEILAAAGGVVVVQEYHPAYGNMVEIDHGNDIISRYAHASRVLVKKGDVVTRGQPIADVGSTGRSTGPHLHFEVWVAGVVADPQKFLDAGSQLAQAPTPTPPKPSTSTSTSGTIQIPALSHNHDHTNSPPSSSRR